MDELTEKTHISITIPTMISFVVAIILGVSGFAGWTTSIQMTVAPLPERVKANEMRLEDMADQQRETCLALEVIQRYTVPETSRRKLNCDRVK